MNEYSALHLDCKKVLSVETDTELPQLMPQKKTLLKKIKYYS